MGSYFCRALYLIIISTIYLSICIYTGDPFNLGPCKFSVKGLPKGLSMDEAGLISGVPDDTPGISSIELQVSDSIFPQKGIEKKEYTLALYQPVTITTKSLPVMQKNNRISTFIKAEGGSGEFIFSVADIPAGLKINNLGEISGEVKLARGTHELAITVTDRSSHFKTKKKLSLTVVDFFPDDYEAMKDNEFTSLNVMLPGEPTQSHSFNQPGDIDIIKLDLRNARIGDVIQVKTNKLSTVTKPILKLHREDETALEVIDASGQDGYAGFLYVCDNPGIYYVSLKEASGETGDYSLVVINKGPKVKVLTKNFQDLLKKTEIKLEIKTTNGSGDFLFFADDLPKGLILSNNGIINGNINVPSGKYSFLVTVFDKTWKGVITEQPFTLTVVDFLPDKYEAFGDNDFNTKNILTPENTIWLHTFNQKGDKDYTKLDLSTVKPGSIIDIQTSRLTEDTNTQITLYGPDKSKIVPVVDTKLKTYSRLLFECNTPGIYFLLVEEPTINIGDYGLAVVNTGPKVKFKTEKIPDVLKKGENRFQLEAADGSGRYRFSAKSLPGKLSINDKGLLLITDDTGLEKGDYPFTIKLDDNAYPGVFTEKKFILTVVDFFPDKYETAGDNGFQTKNIIKPGDVFQYHTFNYDGDVDYLTLDLTGITKGNVIHIATSLNKNSTKTVLSLFNPEEKKLISDEKTPETPYSNLYFKCPAPDIYSLKVSERANQTGDYRLTITDLGPAVQILTESIPDALTDGDYRFQLKVENGSGKYGFLSSGLPKSLSIKKDGSISGKTSVAVGSYPFSITVDDIRYTGITATKQITLKVVDFFPDKYETAGDNNFFTTNKMIPGDKAQKHTFNYPGDEDYIKLDLSKATSGDVVIIESSKRAKETDTQFVLYNDVKNELKKNDNGGKGNYAKLVFQCLKPGFYYLKISNTTKETGDYNLIMNNSGQPLKIITGTIPKSESLVAWFN